MLSMYQSYFFAVLQDDPSKKKRQVGSVFVLKIIASGAESKSVTHKLYDALLDKSDFVRGEQCYLLI